MPEYFDVVNKRDKIIGRALRSECHSNPKLIHRGVFVIVIKGKKMLLQKRSMNKDINPGKWEILGEHNKTSESCELAAMRGLKEELGIKGKPKKIGKLFLSSEKESEFDEIYLYNVSDKKIIFNKNEIDAVKFFTLPEINQIIEQDMLSDWCVIVLKKFKKNLNF